MQLFGFQEEEGREERGSSHWQCFLFQSWAFWAVCLGNSWCGCCEWIGLGTPGCFPGKRKTQVGRNTEAAFSCWTCGTSGTIWSPWVVSWVEMGQVDGDAVVLGWLASHSTEDLRGQCAFGRGSQATHGQGLSSEVCFARSKPKGWPFGSRTCAGWGSQRAAWRRCSFWEHACRPYTSFWKDIAVPSKQYIFSTFHPMGGRKWAYAILPLHFVCLLLISSMLLITHNMLFVGLSQHLPQGRWFLLLWLHISPLVQCFLGFRSALGDESGREDSTEWPADDDLDMLNWTECVVMCSFWCKLQLLNYKWIHHIRRGLRV